LRLVQSEESPAVAHGAGPARLILRGRLAGLAIPIALVVLPGLLPSASAWGQSLGQLPRLTASAYSLTSSASPSSAQTTSFASPPQPILTKGKGGSAPKQGASTHRFWDRENRLLFLGVGLSRGLDFASTRNFRARHRNEILLNNATVDNLPRFAGIEVAGTATSIGFSYLMHRTGHHRLERWVSIAHISITGVGVIHNYSLETGHPAPAANAAWSRGFTVQIPDTFSRK
jgi:hypothetical protein